MQIEKISQAQLQSILDEEKVGVASAFLEKLRLGSMPTPRSPLFGDLSSDEVFSRWLQVLNREESKYPELVEYDKSRLEKVGPQGGYPPFTDRFADFEGYYTSAVDKLLLDPETEDYLVDSVRKLLFGSARNKRPLSYEKVLERDTLEDKLNTNSGCPSFGRRSDPFIQKRSLTDAYSGKWETYPALVGSRGQRGKDRFFFLFPMSTNIVEKSFLIPLMDEIRSRKVLSFSAWEGFAPVEKAMDVQQFFNARTLISTDYKAMDKHCGVAFTAFIYKVISPFYQESYHSLLLRSLQHVNKIPLMIGIDKVVYGEHGLASGSGWTNFTESVYSQCVRLLLARDLGLVARGDQGLGDDGALSFEPYIKDVAERFAYVSRLMGLSANPDKQRVSSNTIIYLQRFFISNIFVKNSTVVAGCYPSILALNSAMNPERFHDPRKWNEKMEIIRWIMILENCVNLPYFHDLIEFFVEGDKFKLGLTIPGFFKRGIVSTFEEAKSITGFVPSYNQVNMDRGILEFEVVKYLRARGS